MNYHEYEENPFMKLTAKTVRENKLVYARNTTKKEGPFYCPDTYEEVIIRKCIEKQDHFAYKARQSPIGSKESDLHKNCKNEICSALQKKFPEGHWETERENFNANPEKNWEKVRPDISGRIGKKGIIIEVQASTLSIKKIIHRTEQYTKRGGYILWIVPLEEELGNGIFRPRLFERFLHSMYYGRIYYWYQGNGSTLIPVHYDTATRYIEISEWHDSSGNYHCEGGYDKPYTRVKKPSFGTEVDLADFTTTERDFFELKNEKLSIPSSKIFKDSLNPWWKEKSNQ